MKFAVMITFSNGTQRFLTWSNGREWKAEPGKEAEYNSFETCLAQANSFGLMSLSPKVIAINDEGQLLNGTLEEENDSELWRLVKLQEERSKKNEVRS